MTTGQERAERTGFSSLAAVLVFIVLGSAVAVAVWQISTVLEQRRVASAAVEMHLSAKTVVTADSRRAAGLDALVAGSEDLARAVNTLEDSTATVAFAALETQERDRAELLLTAVATRGRSMLSAEAGVGAGAPQQHVEFQELLVVGHDRAEADAAEAGRRAVVALVMAGIAAIGAAVLLFRFRRAERAMRAELTHQAVTDHLTGLPNRRMLGPVYRRFVDRLDRSEGPVGLLILDLDGFKAFNDLFGHSAGDEVLRQVSGRLRAVADGEDELIRLGGDEFAIALGSRLDEDSLLDAGRGYLAAFEEPVLIDGRVEHLRPSIGAAMTDDPAAVESLITDADQAMYQAKRAGGGEVVLFEDSSAVGERRDAEITRALRGADFDREFRLVFQPIVAIGDGQPIAYEALLRWDSPILGEVGPYEFIPVAELNGAICDIGTWVLGEVCRQLQEWNRNPAWAGTAISWNVSARQLASADFVDGVRGALDQAGAPAEQLIVEVTESVVLDEVGAVALRLNDLRQSGVRVAIDDFGSGYSNLGQLLDVPFDIIKIDRSLLVKLSEMRSHMGGDTSQPCAIMTGVVSIAGIFGASVVCEGVETELQQQSLLASGISHAQGYLFGRPVPVDELTGADPGHADSRGPDRDARSATTRRRRRRPSAVA